MLTCNRKEWATDKHLRLVLWRHIKECLKEKSIRSQPDHYNVT